MCETLFCGKKKGEAAKEQRKRFLLIIIMMIVIKINKFNCSSPLNVTTSRGLVRRPDVIVSKGSSSSSRTSLLGLLLLLSCVQS